VADRKIWVRIWITYFLIVIIGSILFGLTIESTILMLAFFVLLVMVSILLIAIAADAGLVIDLILLSILAFFGWRQFLFGY
jgi:hypothetical protein